ncbi:hypothetical protein DFJ73DRAFT_842107 [Zopfochytrium polystomum]|nr:hypothetical protein DFJ73DRAFT_842107 [Zopfochytrium polystomum]
MTTTTTTTAAAPVPSQEILARKWDRCVSNTLIASGVGLSVGIGLSFLFFRRRFWPIALSTGFGLGVAYDDCSKSFNPELALSQRFGKLGGGGGASAAQTPKA